MMGVVYDEVLRLVALKKWREAAKFIKIYGAAKLEARAAADTRISESMLAAIRLASCYSFYMKEGMDVSPGAR